jgi:hypothetical protein
MARIGSMQQIREMIRQKMADNLVKQMEGKPTNLHNALEMVNQNTMWRLVQWLHEIILPKIEQKRGKETQEYINHEEMHDCLIWAMYILQQYEEVLMRYGKQRQLLKFYQQENARMENELLKYAAAEQMAGAEAGATYMKAIVRRAVNLMETKTNNNENAKLP